MVINIRPKVDLNLDNGIYLMGIQSAVGKTYLYKLLKGIDEPKCACITYDDVKLGIDIKSIFDNYKPEVCIFDRYDMYADKYVEEIKNYKDKAIILIDCKQGCQLSAVAEPCSIELFEDRVEVIA